MSKRRVLRIPPSPELLAAAFPPLYSREAVCAHLRKCAVYVAEHPYEIEDRDDAARRLAHTLDLVETYMTLALPTRVGPTA